MRDKNQSAVLHNYDEYEGWGDDYNVRYLFIVIVDHFGNWREFLTSFDSLVK